MSHFNFDNLLRCFSIIPANFYARINTFKLMEEKDGQKTIKIYYVRTRVFRKVKHVVDEKLYKRLYPTPSKPGSFYGTAKVHKLKEREGVDKLTLRPIISNIETATYEIGRYLAELLALLGKSKHTI